MMKYNPSLYPFESKWIDINNHHVHYVEEGEGPILLFSHAALGSSFMYRRFIQHLSNSFRCIALDYPGFGLSTDNPDQDYDVLSQSQMLEEFIQKLDLSEIIGLGHDTGGPSLFKVAVDHPEWFAGLILTDTIIFPTKEYPRIHSMLRVVGSSFFQTINAWTNLLIRLTFSLGVQTRNLSSEEKSQYYALFNTRHKRRRITQLLASLREHETMLVSIATGFAEQLQNTPMLLLYGDKDPVVQLGIADRIYGLLNQSSLHMVEGEGHFPHEGQADQMCKIILEWGRRSSILSDKAELAI